MTQEFTREELLRYSRHMVLPEVGSAGQKKLHDAGVLLVGAGGLGSPAALYLAAAGVGKVGIVDFDEVDLTNLHRQIIHGTDDVGRSKLDSAEKSIRGINPNVVVVKHEARLSSKNAFEIVQNYDLVVDGADNFPTRYLVNDVCVLQHKLNMYGSIFRFDGQATVFCAPGGPCYRCLYPEPPPPGLVPNCAEGGVLGVLPGVIGLIQATEAVKTILGIGKSLVGRLLLYDALAMSFQEVRIKRDPDCPICGDTPTQTELIDYESFCGLHQVDVTEDEVKEIEAETLRDMIEANALFTLLDVREPSEYEIDRIDGSVLIPLGQLPERLGELDPRATIIVHCRSGIRSVTACKILNSAGFKDAASLRGGILQWQRTGE